LVKQRYHQRSGIFGAVLVCWRSRQQRERRRSRSRLAENGHRAYTAESIRATTPRDAIMSVFPDVAPQQARYPRPDLDAACYHTVTSHHHTSPNPMTIHQCCIQCFITHLYLMFSSRAGFEYDYWKVTLAFVCFWTWFNDRNGSVSIVVFIHDFIHN